MRRAATLILLCFAAAGCGGGATTTSTSTATATRAPRTATVETRLRVAVLGDARVSVPGAAEAPVADAELVVVGPEVRGVRALAAAHPDAHFVLVGRSYEHAAGEPNVAGILFREDEAAYLAGIVGGLAATEGGALDATIAWVGTRRHLIANAFRRGAEDVDPHVRVVDAWSLPDAARCKESSLDAIARGATVVFAGRGACAQGALAGARDRNALGLSLADFLRPDVAVDETVRQALRGLYHGEENVVFGASSGAVAVGDLHGRVSADTVVRARQVAQELAAGLRSAD
jgi:basic membrane lipoprotein Med (substrate-binding protein (PBP1-ABC) superfamily)